MNDYREETVHVQVLVCGRQARDKGGITGLTELVNIGRGLKGDKMQRFVLNPYNMVNCVVVREYINFHISDDLGNLLMTQLCSFLYILEDFKGGGAKGERVK